jgi:hypothetical protein
VPANSFLARPADGHYVALCTHEAAVSDVLCKLFLRRHSMLWKEKYVIIVLELFCE